MMADLFQQEPSQQRAPLDAEQAPAGPTGTVPAPPEQLERWHKRKSREFKTVILAKIKPASSPSVRHPANNQPSTPSGVRIARRVRNPTENTLVAQPATMPLATTTDTLRLTEQQEEIERTREQETRDHHERMLQVRHDEEEQLFQSEALQNWLNASVGRFLSQNNRTDRDAPFWTCLKTYDTIADHERSQYIAVHLTSDAIRHKSDLAGRLMQANFARNRQNFEIKVFGASGLELKGYVQMNESTSFDERPSMQVSLSGTMRTLCGAQITLASNRLEPAADPLVWTCGGLISVEDRIYALTVSHPLKSQRHEQGKTDPKENPSEQAFSNQAWGDFGQIAALAESESCLGPKNNDWMLLEVKKHMQLPNISFYNNYVKADTGVQSVSHDADRMRSACKLLTSHGIVAGKIVQGSSYLNFGSITLRALQVLIEEPLVQGDSGSWVVSEDSTAIGVVVAGANGTSDKTSGPIAFVVRMNDIYTAVKQVIPRAEPRVLSDTENAILRHRQIKPEDDNLPGLWSLYVDDIINRFHQSIGEINPPHLVIDDMPSLDLELRPFLMIGQVFPCDESVRDRLHATKLKRWQLRLKGINTHAIEIWNRLHEFERGENFIILLKSLVQAGREAISDLPSDKHSAFHFSHDLRLIVRPDPFTLASYLVSFPTSASRLFVRQIPKANRLAMEVVQHLILHSDLPESVRPGSGLLNDFARLAAITPPLFRRLQWDHKILTTPLPPSDLASILAKASYAERYGCFFVHQSPFSFAMRTFLIRACYNRRISAWNGEAADEREPLAIRLATDWTGEAAYERELRATQNKLSAPCLFIGEGQSKDFPKTGRLIRCPELYEHLYVTPKADGLNDVAGASDAMRYSQMPFVGDQQTRSGLGMHNEDGPANGKMGITNGYGSRVTINSHVNNFFETRNMPPSEEHKPLSDASVTIHDARGSLTERQLDEPESRPHAQSSLAVGSIDIINGYEGRVHVNSNIHNYGPPTT